MGLLNNWLNKKKKEQLAKAGEKAKTIIKEEKADDKVEKKPKILKTEKTSAEGGKEKAVKDKLPLGSRADKILIKPMVTEKSAIAESENKYSFKIAKDADKAQVRKAVQDLYGVTPSRVNIMNTEGRRVRFGRKEGRRSDYKKAIITLPEGKTINIHAGV